MPYDVVLMGPDVTPDVICDAADAYSPVAVLHKHNAVRLQGLSALSARALVRSYHGNGRIDAVAVPATLSAADFGLLTIDMDGTLIANECIDDLAALCGRGKEVATLTQNAMRGELNFTESLKARVAALTDTPKDNLEKAKTMLRLNPGAVELIRFCRRHGIKTYIVSGGFTALTRSLAEKLGMDGAISNVLITKDDTLTGEVRGPAGGKILDADGKRRALEVLAASYYLDLSQTIAVGDGANDIEMLTAAGLGVAYHAKPKVRAMADQTLDHTGLQGIPLLFKEAWI